jgi:hypothetical protein
MDGTGYVSEPHEPRHQARLPCVQLGEGFEFALPRDVRGEYTQHARDKTPHQIDRDGIDVRGLAADA